MRQNSGKVHHKATAKTISVPWYLGQFGDDYFSQCLVTPTSNLWRKYFHEKLVDLTKDQDYDGRCTLRGVSSRKKLTHCLTVFFCQNLDFLNKKNSHCLQD